MAQRVKRLPAMRETWVQSLGQGDPLEKGMATHSSILAWKIPWTEEPGRLQSMGSHRVGHDLVTKQQRMGHMDLPYKASVPHRLIAKALSKPVMATGEGLSNRGS